MDNLGGFLLIGLIWLVGMIFERARKAQGGSRTRPVRRGPPTPSRPAIAEEGGSTLERAFRHLNTELAQAMDAAKAEAEHQGTGRSRARATVPVRWDTRNLDAALEDPTAVDLDDESRAAIARRLREVEARNRPRTAKDHEAFHEAIREPAPQPVAPSTRLARADLRRAIIWNEILGPPVGLR